MGTPLSRQAPLEHEALEATLRHFVGSLDTYMVKHLDTHGLWPALTRGFAESYEESLRDA